MLFKLLYLPSAVTISYISSTSDSALYSEKPVDVIAQSRFRGLFSGIKNKLADNYRRALKAQVDSLLP